jgi:hypothetical protein
MKVNVKAEETISSGWQKMQVNMFLPSLPFLMSHGFMCSPKCSCLLCYAFSPADIVGPALPGSLYPPAANAQATSPGPTPGQAMQLG